MRAAPSAGVRCRLLIESSPPEAVTLNPQFRARCQTRAVCRECLALVITSRYVTAPKARSTGNPRAPAYPAKADRSRTGGRSLPALLLARHAEDVGVARIEALDCGALVARSVRREEALGKVDEVDVPVERRPVLLSQARMRCGVERTRSKAPLKYWWSKMRLSLLAIFSPTTSRSSAAAMNSKFSGVLCRLPP